MTKLHQIHICPWVVLIVAGYFLELASCDLNKVPLGNLASLKRLDEARRPLLPTQNTRWEAVNVDCDGPHGPFWNEFRRNMTVLVEHGREEDLEIYAAVSPWMHTSGPELMNCPLGNVALRFMKTFMHKLTGTAKDQYLTFEFETLFDTFSVSSWFPSKWGGLIIVLITNFLKTVCESKDNILEFCDEQINGVNEKSAVFIQENIDTPMGVLVNETMTAFINSGEDVENNQFLIHEDVALWFAREVLRLGLPLHKTEDGWAAHPYRPLVTKAWRVFDVHARRVYKRYTNFVLYPVLSFHHFVDNFAFMKLLVNLYKDVYHKRNMEWISQNPPPATVNPIMRREFGDKKWIPLKSCNISNMIIHRSGKYRARVFAASAHQNEFVANQFIVMHFSLWSEHSSKTEELMSYGFNRSMYICEPDAQTLFLQLTCMAELPNKRLYRSHATSVSAAGWIRPYRQVFECVIPADARSVQINEVSNHWNGPIKVDLCPAREKKFKTAICMRSLFSMTHKHHDLLETWLHYHLSMGFDHVYLYDHDGTADSPLVRELIDAGKLSYTLGLDKQFSASHSKMVAMQMEHNAFVCDGLVMNHCLQNRAESDWLFFVRGIDKFITSKFGPKTLETFLENWGPLKDQVSGLSIGARNFRDDEFDSNANDLVFLRKRKIFSSDKVWCPVVTPHVHYLMTHNFRPREGFKNYDLDLDELRVNHYQSAIRLGSWRKKIDECENLSDANCSEEKEPWMDWGQNWVDACRAKSDACPYT